MNFKFIEKNKNKIGLALNSPLHKGEGKDFIFIHINKTAGTSIIKIIGKPFRKHLTAKEIIKVIGQKKWDNAYKFSVIRNPWDKVVSHYKFRLNTNQSKINENKISFKEWVSCTYGKNKDPFYYDKPKMFLPQVEWLKNFDGEIDVDKIVRFEDLNNGLNSVFKTLGISQELPHVNKTPNTNYRDYYDEESRQIVSDWFHEDIDTFGYKYEKSRQIYN